MVLVREHWMELPSELLLNTQTAISRVAALDQRMERETERVVGMSGGQVRFAIVTAMTILNFRPMVLSRELSREDLTELPTEHWTETSSVGFPMEISDGDQGNLFWN